MSDYYNSSVGVASTPGNACASTRWLTEEVFALIDLVQRNEAIYNPRHKYYFCRPYVENFWREVDLKLEKNPGASLAKWTNLRISFRREYTNYLEEKTPPCWTYFDRMFFLHPFLRKKHQQSKSLDSQMQDALVQISSLSNRLQRERASTVYPNNDNLLGQHIAKSTSPQPHQLDSYLEYLDEAERNTSELDDIIDDDSSVRGRSFVHSILINDIKSEGEDNPDDFEAEHSHTLHKNVEHDEPDAERDVERDQDDHELRDFILGSIEKRQQQQRLQNLQRLQSRVYYEDFRCKRAKSQESHNLANLSSTATIGSSNNNSSNGNNSSLSNISFVRPTISKPPEIASTHTQNSTQNIINATIPLTSGSTCEISGNTSRLNSSLYHGSFNHSPHSHQHVNRFDLYNLASSTVGNSTTTTTATTSIGMPPNHLSNPTTTIAPELCDCKTDPDAMFLMSLLPDIQKLNGRDRGKIKIAFQNILQDYLYPD